jgi:hypothetical protein
VPDLEAVKANPENKALPAIDIRDMLDAEAPDMSGINLRNLFPTRREEGTSENVPSSSQQAPRKKGRTESSASPSRPTTAPLPSGAVPEAPGADQHLTQLGNIVRSGMLLRSSSQVRGERSVPLWAPHIEYRGRDAVTEEDCIHLVGDECSASMASTLSQAVCLPLDMGEWKKATHDELINNLRRGILMVSQK